MHVAGDLVSVAVLHERVLVDEAANRLGRVPGRLIASRHRGRSVASSLTGESSVGAAAISSPGLEAIEIERDCVRVSACCRCRCRGAQECRWPWRLCLGRARSRRGLHLRANDAPAANPVTPARAGNGGGKPYPFVGKSAAVSEQPGRPGHRPAQYNALLPQRRCPGTPSPIR
jgi:hypothetical protein